jgi:dienelactone hydrolase
MCHNHSPAPPVPDHVSRRSAVSLGDSAVPYLIFDREPDRGSAASHPAVVIATDIFGVTPFYQHLGGRLAEAGYRVAVPDLFHRIGPARDGSRDAALDRRRLLDDVQATADLDAAIEAVVADVAGSGEPLRPPYAVIGFCLGGSLALLSAAKRPEQATITYYAFPRGAPGARVPAPEPIEVAHSIQGPVLAFWGDQDYIDAAEIDQLAAALDCSPSKHEIVRYEGVGHSFLSGLTAAQEDSGVATASWSRSLAFLDTQLSASVGP